VPLMHLYIEFARAWRTGIWNILCSLIWHWKKINLAS